MVWLPVLIYTTNKKQPDWAGITNRDRVHALSFHDWSGRIHVVIWSLMWEVMHCHLIGVRGHAFHLIIEVGVQMLSFDHWCGHALSLDNWSGWKHIVFWWKKWAYSDTWCHLLIVTVLHWVICKCTQLLLSDVASNMALPPLGMWAPV